MMYFFKYLLLTLAFITGVWTYFNLWGIENGTIYQQIVYAFSQLDIKMLLLFLGFWGASIFGGAFRYKMLGRGWGAHIPLMVCLKATTVSRAFTLLTPTMLIGGQPLGYIILSKNGVPKKTAGGIVFVATVLDIKLFLFVIPSLLLIHSTQTEIMEGLYLILWITLVLFIFIILVGWFLLSRYYYLAVRILAALWSFIVPVWNKESLEETFEGWQKKFKSFFNLKAILSKNSLYAIVSTALIFVSHYIGVWFLLKGIGCHQSLLHNISNQFYVNAGTAILSPGGGTLTGEIGFKILIGKYLRPELLYGAMFLFMLGTYWFNILLGTILVLFEKIRSSIVNIHFMPKFYSTLSNDVQVNFTLENGEKITQTPKPPGECSFIVPYKSKCLFSVSDNGKTILEKEIVADKYSLDIELGPPNPPHVDYSIPTRVLFKMYITMFLTRRFFRWVVRRNKKGKSPLPLFWGRLLHLPSHLYSQEHNDIMLSQILSSYNRLPTRARKMVVRMLSNYLGGRIQRLDIQTREGWEMPDVLSIHLTNVCNLNCTGCNVQKEKKMHTPFNMLKYVDLLGEFRSLGGRFVLLLGGEPMLLKQSIFKLTKEFPELTFLLFSNGTYWGSEDILSIIRQGNIIPVLSIEGNEQMTDARRGRGVYAKINQVQQLLARKGILHGISVMVTENNSQYVRKNDFLSNIFNTPHHFTLLMAYTERNSCLNLKTLSAEMMKAFIHDLEIAKKNGLLAVFLPYDEMRVSKGCGATRNLMHINIDFSISRCPYTYDYILEDNFDEGLRSTLKKIQSRLMVNSKCLSQCRYL